MGCPCDYLIPVAILYQNPQGLTLEEFNDKIKFISDSAKNEKFFLGNFHFYNPDYFNLASSILNLNHTEEYDSFKKTNWDEGLKYFKEVFSWLSINKNRKSKYTIIKQFKKAINEHLTLDVVIADNLNRGGYTSGDYIDITFVKIPEKYKNKPVDFQVKEILESKTEYEDVSLCFINQKVAVRAVETIYYDEKKFKTLSQLLKQYPYYSPERVFDFSQDSGFLFSSSLKNTKRFSISDPVFSWFKKDGKIFLDISFMLDHLSPNSFYAEDARDHWSGSWKFEQTNWMHKRRSGTYFSLTDLILTCEAIRAERWDCISYDGFRANAGDFIYSSPEILANYEKAIIDNEFSQIAINGNINHFDFLRMHMKAIGNLESISFEKKKEIYLKERDKYKKHLARKSKQKKEEKLKEEDDLPF